MATKNAAEQKVSDIACINCNNGIDAPEGLWVTKDGLKHAGVCPPFKVIKVEPAVVATAEPPVPQLCASCKQPLKKEVA